MYETGAPPAPPPLPDQPEVVEAEVRAVRPAKGYDAASVIAGLGGPPPGAVTFRLRGVESSQDI